jgi:hypothetical protein
MAAITGAAVSMLASDGQRLRMGKGIVVLFGCLSALTALAHGGGSALSMWFSVSAIASGGLAGLFVLAYRLGYVDAQCAAARLHDRRVGACDLSGGGRCGESVV